MSPLLVSSMERLSKHTLGYRITTTDLRSERRIGKSRGPVSTITPHGCRQHEDRLRSSFMYTDVPQAVLREFVLGLWKIHILHNAAVEGVVGHHLLQELRRHGYDVSPGTLYPLLHRMERNGWLSAASAASGSHAGRSYEITPAGATVLAQITEYVAELHAELATRNQQPARTL